MSTTIEQLPALERRKNALALQNARYGISADPHVSIELSDLETIIGQMKRIDIHRGNLAHLLRQRGHFGADVSPHIVNQINSEREQIATLRAACAKRGHPVASHPVDTDQVEVEVEQPAPTPFPADPIARVREALRDIEALIRHGQADAALGAVQALRHEIGG
jgi:hypothetical protein